MTYKVAKNLLEIILLSNERTEGIFSYFDDETRNIFVYHLSQSFSDIQAGPKIVAIAEYFHILVESSTQRIYVLCTKGLYYMVQRSNFLLDAI